MADSTDSYDAIVIGAGQGGGPLSSALARAGKRTALIERAKVGGTCINYGCTPTKTIIASARIAHLARRAPAYGVDVGSIDVDLGAVRQRKREVVESFRKSSLSQIQGTEGLELIKGDASFEGKKELAVALSDGGVRHIEAELIVLDTGDSPMIPSLTGLDKIPYLDSTSIMEMHAVPRHLLILGGGYIAVEFAQAYRRFGSRVTIVQRGEQLLSREDPDVAQEMEKILREDGIEIKLGITARSVGSDADGTVYLDMEKSGESKRPVFGSHLLVATGRTPNTATLNLPSTGIQPDEHGYVQVDEKLETSVPGIYALGDMKGGPAFTHISYDDFRILRANLLEGGTRTTRGRLVPYTVFSDPQLGRIGMTEKEARAFGRNVKVARMPMSDVARAIEVDETRGMLKAVVDADSKQILGAAALAVEGGEIMAMFEIAMMGGLPYTALQNAIFAHPTLAEALNNLFSSLE